jgi:DNA repair exonuclease SbcCD ATPase subunit
MYSRLSHYGLTFLLLLLFIATGYFGVQAITKNPCALPKTWSLSPIDPRFGISQETVKLYSTESALPWNDAYPANELLHYQERDGDIKITFVYDERQRTTIRNERLKQTIEMEKDQLDDLKRTIESLRAEYSSLEETITKKTEDYTSHLSQHNSEVSYWNSKGGAPTDDYQALQRDEASLETERAALNALINRFNKLAGLIKNYGRDHNEVVDTLNNQIETLNETALRDFEEGTYDPNTKTITIYEYADATALKRVLTHEFGHALGLKHVDDKGSIMYPINQGENLELAEADKEELQRVCQEKTGEDIIGIIKATRDDISHLLVSSWPGITALLK